MEIKSMIYEGKAKKVFATDQDDIVLVSYKDDATAFNGEKKGTILGKGVVNNRMSNFLMQKLEEQGVPTHYVEECNERDTLVKKVEIVPLEVIIRNKACGSFSKRYGVAEGTELSIPTIEFSYKNDDLGDPLINDSHALALNLATQEEIDEIKRLAYKVNDVLIAYFKTIEIELVDFKLEFGRYQNQIVLADEISPDTCRLWDIHTHARLDKDRFRRDMGDVEEAYLEVFKRLGI
ncbi:MAG: phosphoribosylaminoimidazolesuccinocarboxamide synthase [Erysipelotrichaceae bacterium]|nr:phosphoribosylaminoimidazolesuccinocarboxamide synthase [Erysipelotrichaceae bacterium]MCI9523812.1 phosphoribosylaminoimidazolesuccinocarboxamide synthase [Erysipelotrichaceae bacterium]